MDYQKIKAAKIIAKLNLRIRLSYAGNAVQRPGRTVRLSISGKGICDQVSLITLFGFPILSQSEKARRRRRHNLGAVRQMRRLHDEVWPISFLVKDS
jgi:hypothetical protein